MPKNDVVALGEILIDFTEVGKNEMGNRVFAQNPGGAPANVCVALNRLGDQSAFVGKVGKDMHGDFLIDVLNKEGVNTDSIISDPNFFTTLAFVSLDDNGERKFSFARKPGADTQITFEEIDKDLIDDAKVFHVGSLSLTDEPARTATYEAVDYAKKNGKVISYDPNYRDSLWPDEETAIKMMRSLIPKADLMKISDEEITLLTGETGPEAAAETLLRQGPQLVLITLGADGSLAATKNHMVKVKGFKSEVADTTGAGDSFLAGFLHKLLEAGVQPEELTAEQLEQALAFANATAALTVRELGAIPALPTLEQVNELLEAEN